MVDIHGLLNDCYGEPRMKKLILLFIVCFICVNASAMEQVTDVNIKKNLEDNLKKTGKTCSKCIDAYVLSKDNEKICSRLSVLIELNHTL